MTLDYLTSFLGWCSVINIVILMLSALMLSCCKMSIPKLHSKMFGVDMNDLPLEYFRFLGNYKLAIFVFNIVPYIALRIMT